MPSDPCTFSLFEALSETGFQASVISTYSCYFPFYEEVVLRRLVDRGCTNNILLVDGRMCAEACAKEETRPRRAGRDYTLVPVHLAGAFHPKLIVVVGKSKGALFVGSHNMTLAGFGLNDEITNEFRTSGAGARQGSGVVRQALKYLQGFVPESLGAINDAFTIAQRNVPWLVGPMPVESAERVLITTTGLDEDLWSRILPLVPKLASEAFVCGPFFDESLTFLKRLADDVKPKRLVIGIDPESVDLKPAVAQGLTHAQFVNVAGQAHVLNKRASGSRYLHAKALWFSGPEGDLLVTGSANPSRPAFLSESEWRNAEAVVVDRRAQIAEALGLDELATAPRVEPIDWGGVQDRQALKATAAGEKAGTVLLAVPVSEGLRLERAISPTTVLSVFAADEANLGVVTSDPHDQTLIVMTSSVRDSAARLCTNLEESHSLTVLVHSPEAIGRTAGGDRQRELRKALGALDEDPALLETLLKLTEKVIFESDDIPPVQKLHAANSHPEEELSSSTPQSLAVDAAGKPASRRKRRLATGDIVVLMDILMQQLGEGLQTDGHHVAGNNNTGEDPENGDVLEPRPIPDYEELAAACRNKAARLIRRMIRHLADVPPSGARRVVVQLAAVLSLIRALRIREQRVEWRSKRLQLVSRGDEWRLLDSAALSLAWGASSIACRALIEGSGEPFDELSLTVGLLAWLAWDVDIDVRASLTNARPVGPEVKDDRWRRVQTFAALCPHLSADSDARSALSHAVSVTPRRGADEGLWLKTHLELADRFGKVASSPDEVVNPVRGPQRGDLVVLGAAMNPRVRVVMNVLPSGASDKVEVVDLENERGYVQYVAAAVRYIPWWSPPSGKLANNVVQATSQ